MNISQQGLGMIREFESFQPVAYLDSVGIPTIGYGTTMINGQAVTIGMTCSEEQAEAWMAVDIQSTEAWVNKYLNVPVTQEQFDALCSFVYNLGPTNFRGSTLLKVINGIVAGDAQAEFLRWNKAKGQVFRGLTRRRVTEAALFGPMSATQLIQRYNLVV